MTEIEWSNDADVPAMIDEMIDRLHDLGRGLPGLTCPSDAVCLLHELRRKFVRLAGEFPKEEQVRR